MSRQNIFESQQQQPDVAGLMVYNSILIIIVLICIILNHTGYQLRLIACIDLSGQLDLYQNIYRIAPPPRFNKKSKTKNTESKVPKKTGTDIG